MTDLYFFFFKQKTAYEMRISDWSSDVCSSDLPQIVRVAQMLQQLFEPHVQLQRLALEFDEFGFRQEDAAEHYLAVVAVAETVVPARAYRQLAEPQFRARCAEQRVEADDDMARIVAALQAEDEIDAAAQMFRVRRIGGRQRTRLNSSNYCATRMAAS